MRLTVLCDRSHVQVNEGRGRNVMVNHTWLGGGNNNASNAKDWSPTGAPQPGETALISQGTIKIANSDLHADNLEVFGNSQIDLTNDAVMPSIIVFTGQASVSVHGSDTFRLETLS